MRRWWNGRHEGLKILCLIACGFDSLSPYMKKDKTKPETVIQLTIAPTGKFFNNSECGYAMVDLPQYPFGAIFIKI